MREIGIGLLGFGTVGAGVVDGLQKNAGVIADRLGVRPVLRRIADLDLETDRGVAVDRELLTSDAASVIADPGVDVVVELIGGTGVAKELVTAALEAGKPVVTANKALLAEHGEEIFGLALRKNTEIRFGASVGGGIPVIRALREGLVGNRIESIYGILNGTCNYILTRMENEGLSFDAALAEAQAAGYAEADPALDIDGFDTAHKAVILASLAHGFSVPMDSVHVEGIRGLSELDIRYALDFGYRIKLLAVIANRGGSGNDNGDASSGGIEVRVHPALVPLDEMLASVSGVFNAVMLSGDLTGDTLYYGRGAGKGPTASTVIGDIADLARTFQADCKLGFLPAGAAGPGRGVRDMHEVETRYYLRLSLLDKPGVLAQITTILGREGVSLASVLQKEGRSDDHVPVVAVTHRALERSIDAALADIDKLDIVAGKTVRLRIEGEKERVCGCVGV